MQIKDLLILTERENTRYVRTMLKTKSYLRSRIKHSNNPEAYQEILNKIEEIQQLERGSNEKTVSKN